MILDYMKLPLGCTQMTKYCVGCTNRCEKFHFVVRNPPRQLRKTLTLPIKMTILGRFNHANYDKSLALTLSIHPLSASTCSGSLCQLSVHKRRAHLGQDANPSQSHRETYVTGIHIHTHSRNQFEVTNQLNMRVSWNTRRKSMCTLGDSISTH